MSFSDVTFKGELRPSQLEVVEVARKQFGKGNARLHIVAPPGAGKTVLGLYLWAMLVRKPCLVLSPNSAIQAQWLARTDLFNFSGIQRPFGSSDPRQPALLNSLTYQAISLPARNLETIDVQALSLWCKTLIEKQQVFSQQDAETWIRDLKLNNPEYYEKQIANYKKRIRELESQSGRSISLLHDSSKQTLERLGDFGIGVVIADECHHLLGHWGRVLADALPLLGNPVVIGLTATPPDKKGKDETDVQRYDNFLGPIDYEVPVPAVVKDGFLSPYQDLAYFVRPTGKELEFIASADQNLEELIEGVCNQDFLIDTNSESNEDSEATKNLTDWLMRVLSEFRLPTGKVESWVKFERRDPVFALASRQFLQSRRLKLPENVPALGPADAFNSLPSMEYLVPVLDRFVRHFLRRSPIEQHQKLAKDLVASLRLLGVQITDTGVRPCASPVGRVLAYSKSKANALIPILQSEVNALGEKIRVVVVADFEKTSAVSTGLRSLMDDETGGAIAAFKTLLKNTQTDRLDPVLLTGSTVLIDDEIEVDFLRRCDAWVTEKGLKVKLSATNMGDFRQILGTGADWTPRVYVELITELFQEGITKCLIGTRGLLGEGWDANKINVLIDLTTVTTSMSINQLRGRSFRLDPEYPQKLANNWDIVCLATEFSKGFDDYRRFKDKHKSLYGVTDDGAIEKGVAHVHPAFTEIMPEGLENSVSALNEEMLSRACDRGHVRSLWKIGEPFENEVAQAVEVKFRSSQGGFPPFHKANDPWNEHSLTAAIAECIISSMNELGKLKRKHVLQTGMLTGGYVRAFLLGASAGENRAFADAMQQIMGPIDRPRYVIPRSVSRKTETLISKLLPEIIGKYFRRTQLDFAMLHAVPDVLAKNKSDVAVFQKYWNQSVSPGDAIYAHRGKGQQMLEEAKIANHQPNTITHNKEVFH